MDCARKDLTEKGVDGSMTANQMATTADDDDDIISLISLTSYIHYVISYL